MPNILNQLIVKSRAKGISQKTLASSIGMTSEGFSRAKKRGDMRVSDLSSIAAVVGMELRLVNSSVSFNALESTGVTQTKSVNSLRKCEKLGFSFPYDWSFGELSDELIIKKVLDRFIFHDVVVACARFGFNRVNAIFSGMQPSDAAIRSMENIRRAI